MPRPTEAACHVIGLGLEGTEPPVLSASEETLLRVAWDFWNGQGDATIGRISMNLDGPTQTRIAELLRASVGGPEAIDAWLLAEECRIYRDGLLRRQVP